ncbi:MAG TPA: glycerophosphodiester phosphodiesterase [Polyangiaceae bacterium]|nr:glycerophosphodiester phosphodiesterase [Polyangiaceae bacterium]
MLPIVFAHCSPDGTVVPAGATEEAASSPLTLGHRDIPLIIGHRGAPGYRPEHTFASYELAIEMGADFIEPDCVSTKDHVLVVRHENEIGGTTDVASHPEFADRKATKTVDGTAVTGWFTEDFTLAELKTLRARERLPDIRPANTAFDGLYTVPTLQEVIDFAKAHGVGIYPETKHPTYFASIGLPLEELLARTLHNAGWSDASDPVFLQSFEPSSLQKLKRLTNLRRIQLLDETKQPYDFTVAGDPRTYADLVKPKGLAFIATYANGIGPSKNWVVPRDATGKLTTPTTLVSDAHRLGLLVHLWTFRNENNFLPTDFRGGNPNSTWYLQERGDAPAEYRLFFGLGIDGLFSDDSDTAVATRAKFFKQR